MPDENRGLDRWLEAALQQYGNAGHRPGLEERVLARVRIEQEQSGAARRWRWPVLALAAAAAVLAAIFLLQPPKIHQHQQSVTKPPQLAPPNAQTKKEASLPLPSVTNPRRRQHGRPHQAAADEVQAFTAPKREQFPSPAPLTAQEKMLAYYVTEYRERAVMVARAQTEMAKRDASEQKQLQIRSSAHENKED